MDPSCHLSCSQVATLNASFILSCSLHLDAPWTHLGLLHLASELDGSKLPPWMHRWIFIARFPPLLWNPNLRPHLHITCFHLDTPWTHLDGFKLWKQPSISPPQTPSLPLTVEKTDAIINFLVIASNYRFCGKMKLKWYMEWILHIINGNDELDPTHAWKASLWPSVLGTST